MWRQQDWQVSRETVTGETGETGERADGEATRLQKQRGIAQCCCRLSVIHEKLLALQMSSKTWTRIVSGQLECNAGFYRPLQDNHHHDQAAKTPSMVSV